MMGFEEVRQALTTLQTKQTAEEERLMVRIEELSRELSAVRQELATAKQQIEQERRDKADAINKLGKADERAIAARSDVAAQIATLEVEKEIMAQRDRESREEIERLRLAKKAPKRVGIR